MTAGNFIARVAALILVISLALAIHQEQAHAGQPQTESHYIGSVVGDPATTLEIEVRSLRGKAWVKASAENVQIHCDDGSVLRSERLVVRAEFRGASYFSGEYASDVGSTSAQYLETSGRLLTQGRARGQLIFLTDYKDGPFPSYAGIDCSTGQAEWKAKRVKR